MKNLQVLSMMMLSVLSMSLFASDPSQNASAASAQAGSGQFAATAQANGWTKGSGAARRAARRQKLAETTKGSIFVQTNPNAQANFAKYKATFQNDIATKMQAAQANGGSAAAGSANASASANAQTAMANMSAASDSSDDSGN